MIWLKRLALLLALTSCASSGYDGETLIRAMPDGCEKQWKEFYICEFDISWYNFWSKCKMEVCDE